MNRFQGVRSLTREETSSSVLERLNQVRSRYRTNDSKSRNRYMQVREYKPYSLSIREEEETSPSLIQGVSQYLRVD
jgi:hypothetical protein